MEIILLERVANLGKIGDVVVVRAGYARNFLLPKKKAVRSTKRNREHFEHQKASIIESSRQLQSQAQEVAGELSGLTFVLLRSAGDVGHLYGSVSSRDIANAISTETAHQISKSQVVLNSPIKTIGLHEVAISLHPEVKAIVQINVARSLDEANLQINQTQKASDLTQEAEIPAEQESSKDQVA